MLITITEKAAFSIIVKLQTPQSFFGSSNEITAAGLTSGSPCPGCSTPSRSWCCRAPPGSAPPPPRCAPAPPGSATPGHGLVIVDSNNIYSPGISPWPRWLSPAAAGCTADRRWSSSRVGRRTAGRRRRWTATKIPFPISHQCLPSAYQLPLDYSVLSFKSLSK